MIEIKSVSWRASQIGAAHDFDARARGKRQPRGVEGSDAIEVRPDLPRDAELAVRRYAAQGFDIKYVHRTDRTGFKAGALDAGLGHAGYRDLAFSDYRYGSLGLAWHHRGLQIGLSRIFSTSLAPTVRGPRAVLSVLWGL